MQRPTRSLSFFFLSHLAPDDGGAYDGHGPPGQTEGEREREGGGLRVWRQETRLRVSLP